MKHGVDKAQVDNCMDKSQCIALAMKFNLTGEEQSGRQSAEALPPTAASEEAAPIDALQKLSLIKLKKYLVAHGVAKTKVDSCVSKPELLALATANGITGEEADAGYGGNVQESETGALPGAKDPMGVFSGDEDGSGVANADKSLKDDKDPLKVWKKEEPSNEVMNTAVDADMLEARENVAEESNSPNAGPTKGDGATDYGTKEGKAEPGWVAELDTKDGSVEHQPAGEANDVANDGDAGR